jgi:hypothetical protein
MVFPLWKFWTYSPLGFLAAIIWNISEICGFSCPFAPTLFGWIMGAKGRRRPLPEQEKGE